MLSNLQFIPLVNKKPIRLDKSRTWTNSKDLYPTIQPDTPCGVFGYLMLDLDVKQADHNIDQLLSYLQTLGLDTNTFTVKTKSGGLHLYYNYPDDMSYRDSTSWIKSPYGNVDIRGNNTWCMAPEAFTLKPWTIGTYAVINDAPPIDCTLDSLLYRSAEYKDVLHMQKISCNERDSSVFDIVKELYKRGKSLEDVIKHFDSVTIEENVNDPYVLDLPKLYDRMQNHFGEENMLVAAMKNFIYVTTQDKIYDVTKRRAYPAATFGRALSNDVYEYVNKNNKPDVTSLTKMWLTQRDKKQVEYVGWKPCGEAVYQENGDDFCNLYHPPSYMSQQAKPGHEISEMFMQLVNHLTMGKRKYTEVIVSAMRWHIEHPLEPRTWSITIIGAKGTGKGVLWRTVSSLVGGKVNKVHPSALKTEFNKQFAELNAILFNELDTSKNVNYAAMKELITDKTYTQTGKGTDTDSFERTVYHSSYVFANSAMGLRLERSDRRHFIVNCTNYDIGKDGVKDTKFGGEWVSKYTKYLSDPEVVKTLHDFIISQDYSPLFNPSSPHLTEWFEDMCIASKTEMATDILDALNEDNEFATSDVHTASTVRLMLVLHKNYKDTLTPGHCGRAIEELVSDGTFKVIAQRGTLAVMVEENHGMSGHKIMLIKKRSNPKIIAVRNHDNYMTSADAKNNFFTHLPQPGK